MKENYFQQDKIYYRINDFKPDRKTLVFMHGVAGSSSAWLPYEKIFENKYNILIFDMRGHGMSKKFPKTSDYEIKKFADDLHELVEHLNITKFILISNSFSAQIALEYIKLYRDTVLANIFTSPEIFVKEKWIQKILQLIFKVLTVFVGFLPFNSKPRGHVDYSKHKNSTDWNLARNWADIKNTGIHTHLYCLEKSFELGKKYDLQKINAPTLLIHGEKDTMVPIKNALLMSKEIKNCQFISIPKIDHNTVHNAVKEMSEAIESFVEKQK